MAMQSNQKLKLLYLVQILQKRTDENHLMTVQDMIGALSEYGVPAERKSIYDDISMLRHFGYDIVQVKSTTTGYYIGSRDFEVPELKLLVDAVQTSKFITYKKTLSLIEKIENLASRYDAQLLQRQVYVRNRVKSMNESIYYNVDEISTGISQNKMIRFKYFEYTVTKERHFRKDGAFYEVSPYVLMWDDENYYMMAWDEEAAMLKHYRVDKMTEISITEKAREGNSAFAEVDMPSYSKMVFSMFGGKEQTVRLRFTNRLVGAVIDRFGKDVIIVPDGEDHFVISIEAAVSPQFYAWLFAFATEVEIISPDAVRTEMQRCAESIAELYKQQ